jgi:hypothetical protein
MLFLLFLMMLVIIALLIVTIVLMRRIARHTEEMARNIVPAFVDATLALSNAQRAIADIVALVPSEAKDKAQREAELAKAVDDALHVTQVTPRFAPVIPLRQRGTN